MTDQKATQRVMAKDPRGRAETRRFAFSPVILTSTTAGAAQLIVAANSDEVLEFTALNVSHEAHSGGAGPDAEVSLCLVDIGGTASDANAAFSALKVSDGMALDLGGQLLLNPGQSLYAFASDADHLRVSGWVTAHL